MAGGAKFHSPVCSTFEELLVQSYKDAVMEKNWAHSVDQCWLQALQFLVHLINLLSLLLRCNGFARIQKDQTGRKTTKQWPWPIFGTSLVRGSALELFSAQPLSWSSPIWYIIHFSSHITIQLRNGSLLLQRIREDSSKWQFLLILSQLMRYPLIKLFHLSNLLEIPNDHKMVDVESSATSVVIRGSALSVVHCPLSMPAHYAPYLQDSCLLCKTSWRTTALDVH